MDLFKKLFSSASPERNFPAEDGQGPIMMEGNKIACNGGKEARLQGSGNCQTTLAQIFCVRAASVIVAL